ncbi:alpha/beta hydrolase [Pleurocapsales cyanobacterium LEGE 06147]|nr:alpha/beta hydrolase [Pleurocapsales cyanobacterium LEGE 06147]
MQTVIKIDRENSDFLVFVQHGWTDDNKDISRLARALTSPSTVAIAPSLGKLRTWWTIEPLIQQVEQIATATIKKYPAKPIRIIGHSMGGLIWLEVLHRHPEWWQKVDSLVLLGSPIGGSDISRIIDPLNIGIGIARDLGENRRWLAEKIARNIPTLAIASDLGNGSDGLVPVGATKFVHSQFICLPDITHAALKCHPSLVSIIKNFWSNPQLLTSPAEDLATKLIGRLQSTPGMTDAHWGDFAFGQVYLSFANGITLHIWKNLLGVDYVFVADKNDKCLYAGYVGWLHAHDLRKTLAEIEAQIDFF